MSLFLTVETLTPTWDGIFAFATGSSSITRERAARRGGATKEKRVTPKSIGRNLHICNWLDQDGFDVSTSAVVEALGVT